VPWQEALDSLLAAAQLGYVIDGDVIRIVPRPPAHDAPPEPDAAPVTRSASLRN
jgi:hypothetical protein